MMKKRGKTMKSKIMMAIAAVVVAAMDVAAGGRWRPLFADDLSDAVYDAAVWSKDAEGCLTAAKDVAIWTKDDYSRFELSCEYNLEPSANSGILIYCSDTKKWIPNSVEIQLLDDDAPKWKDLNSRQANLSFFGHQAPKCNPTRPAGEWNSITVRADGSRISVTLNGMLVNECDLSVWTDAKKLPNGGDIPPWLSRPWAELATTGKIGLQGRHAGAGVRFRNVRIRSLPPSGFVVRSAGRLAFERAEKDAEVAFRTENTSGAKLADVRAVVCQMDSDGKCVASNVVALGDIAAKGVASFNAPVETRFRPGKFAFDVSVEGRGAKGLAKTVQMFPAAIGPTFAPRMPAIMWIVSPQTNEDVAVRRDAVQEMGFTHAGLNTFGIKNADGDDAAAMKAIRKLDYALASGTRFIQHWNPIPYPPDGPASNHWRRLRDGSQPNDRRYGAAEVSDPAMQAHVRRLAELNADAFGTHPGLGGALMFSEARSHTTYPSFNTEAAKYKAETGRNVPDEVNGANVCFDGAEAKKRFPDGVVPEDDPVLSYWRWFAKGGDGWPDYISAVTETYRAKVGRYGDGSEAQRRRPFFTFFDPAVRCPPIWGSGGNTDILSQWVYAVPEPMSVAGPLEELFAMAAGRPGQDVMMMVQCICYRHTIAPTNVTVNPPPAWFAEHAGARFPAIPPDTLQEAVWSMLAKPVKGVLFYGWGCIYDTKSEWYCFTNPETGATAKRLMHGLVAPLGPALVGLGRDASSIAVFESATTYLMGGGGTLGYAAPAITLLQRARLDPRVVYEETIMRDGLDGIKVLYAPLCRFLTPPVIERIKAFQAAGGILIGDKDMVKALKPDISIPYLYFVPVPVADTIEDVEAAESAKSGDGRKRAGTILAKKNMLDQTETVRRALAERGVVPEVDSSSPEIVTYSRRWKGARYVFAINDKRTFGDYVGQWGLTMEKGLPFEGEVYVTDPSRRIGAVYELSRGGAVKFSRRDDGRVAVPVSYKTNDGRLFVFLREPIARVSLDAAVADGSLKVTFRLFGASGALTEGRLPVEIRVRDASGRELDGAGWACAVDGSCSLSVPLNLDDPPGGYTITARDIASGSSKSMTVKH